MWVCLFAPDHDGVLHPRFRHRYLLNIMSVYWILCLWDHFFVFPYIFVREKSNMVHLDWVCEMWLSFATFNVLHFLLLSINRCCSAVLAVGEPCALALGSLSAAPNSGCCQHLLAVMAFHELTVTVMQTNQNVASFFLAVAKEKVEIGILQMYWR